jgi:predicted exporter
MLPSPEVQQRRGAQLQPAELHAAADALEASLQETGFLRTRFEPAIERLRDLARGAPSPITFDAVRRALPPGLIDGSLQRVDDGRFVADVTVYSTSPDATATLPDDAVAMLQAAAPFRLLSYDTIGRDLQARLASDSRTALVVTATGIPLIVIAGFRSIRLGLFVLMPIAYAALVTVGGLAIAGHRFSGMALAALPLIIGIGIDNGIHFVRRYLESAERDAPRLIHDVGAPLIQTNLTTIIGFGALMTCTFTPLAELGLLTAVGVAVTLFGSLFILPALLAMPRVRGWVVRVDHSGGRL